jgi:hypothetical protein
MRHVITVSPVGDAWQVQAPTVEPALFKSGGRAELSARRLAERLAREGRAVEIEIYLRDGRLAARLPYHASAPPELEPAA